MENHAIQNYHLSEIEAFVFGEENPFLSSSQLHSLPPCDFNQWEFPMPESIIDTFPEAILEPIPLLESIPTDPLNFPSLEIQRTTQGSFYGGWEDEFGTVLNGGVVQNDGDKQIVLFGNENDKDIVREKKVSQCRERKSTSSSELSRETISRYFYMPITQAAKELNVGLTLLKKRCRELGIPRWPHRKLMSLQTLIKNVQEMGAEDGEATIRDALELLERQRKLMEEMPEVELEEKTKKLRQACFKANYKKRKLMGMLEWQSSPSEMLEWQPSPRSHACMEFCESISSSSSQ